MQDIIFVTGTNPNEFKSTYASDPCLMKIAVSRMEKYCNLVKFDALTGPESGAFPYLGVLQAQLHMKCIYLKKPKKKCQSKIYEYSYFNGEGALIVPKNINPGERFMIVEDDLMTGGTILAIIDMIEQSGGIIVGILCAIEWPEFGGKNLLKNYKLFSVAKAFSSYEKLLEWKIENVKSPKNSKIHTKIFEKTKKYGIQHTPFTS